MGSRWQGEIQGPPKNHGVGFANDIVDLLAENLGLKKKRGCVGPASNHHGDDPAAVRKIIGVNLGEGAWPGNARNARVLEHVALARVQRSAANGRFPFIIGRARRSPVARYIGDIYDLKGGYSGSDIHRCGGLD